MPASSKIATFLTSHALASIGLLAGFLILAFSRDISNEDGRLFRLCVCVGFGLILAAAGSAASVKWRGASIAGAGAVALILFWALSRDPQQFTYVTISSVKPNGFPTTAEIVLQANNELLGAFRGKSGLRKYVAILSSADAEGGVLELEVSGLADNPDNDSAPIRIDFDKQVRPYLGKRISWTFDGAKNRIFSDRDRADIAAPVLQDSAASDIGDNLLSRLIPTAIAQTVDGQPDELLKQLDSPNLAVKRAARESLIGLGSAAIAPTLKAVASAKTTNGHREAAGAVYVLARIGRDLGRGSQVLRDSARDSDILMLVGLLDDTDAAVRYYAADFLAHLGDARVASATVNVIKAENSSSDGKFNAAVVLADVVPRISDLMVRNNLRTEVSALPTTGLGERTKAKLDVAAMAKK